VSCTLYIPVREYIKYRTHDTKQHTYWPLRGIRRQSVGFPGGRREPAARLFSKNFPRYVKAKSSAALCEEKNFDFEASRRHLTIKNLIKSSKLRRKKFYRNPKISFKSEKHSSENGTNSPNNAQVHAFTMFLVK